MSNSKPEKLEDTEKNQRRQEPSFPSTKGKDYCSACKSSDIWYYCSTCRQPFCNAVRCFKKVHGSYVCNKTSSIKLPPSLSAKHEAVKQGKSPTKDTVSGESGET